LGIKRHLDRSDKLINGGETRIKEEHKLLEQFETALYFVWEKLTKEPNIEAKKKIIGND